jgi:peptidoglycan/LPS O-acetylase OafA/YrhL
LQYRREIDGLRAVAVLPVILFHAGFDVFSGGFVGVDVFFVISGFLITSILIDELERDDFSIARFYERRARRILPALFVVLLACIPFAWMWMLPAEFKTFSNTLVSVVLFVSNIRLWQQSGYFDTAAELKPLLHTWSLAVEEQYYLLFPLLLLLLWRLGRNRAFWLVAAIAFVSFLLSEYGWRHHPSANFFLAPTRAWELLAGSICAFLTVDRTPGASNLLSATGLALIAFSIFYYDSSTPFPSVYALAPVVGTALVLLYARGATLVARLLSTAPVVGIGLISYSAYLWHQPLFAFARIRSLTEPSPAMMAGLAVASLLLAIITWKYVEQPFRKRSGRVLPTRKGIFVASAAAGSFLILFGISGCLSNGFPKRFIDEHAFLGERLAVNFGLHQDCEGEFNKSPNCYTSKSPEVLLWGDSFAMHLMQGLVASEEKLAIQQHTKSACSPVLGIAPVNQEFRLSWAKECIEFNGLVLEWLKQNPSVKVVVLSSRFTPILDWGFVDERGRRYPKGGTSIALEKLAATIDEVRSHGAKVVVVSPPPSDGRNIGECLKKSILWAHAESFCDFKFEESNSSYEFLKRASEVVPIYWIHENICPGGNCGTMRDGLILYRDAGHLSKEGSAYLGRENLWSKTWREIAR